MCVCVSNLRPSWGPDGALRGLQEGLGKAGGGGRGGQMGQNQGVNIFEILDAHFLSPERADSAQEKRA